MYLIKYAYKYIFIIEQQLSVYDIYSVRETNDINREYRLCSEASALRERSSKRYVGCRVRETNNCWAFGAFAHRLYLMLNSVLVVAISIAPPAQRSPTSCAYSEHPACRVVFVQLR